MLSYVSLLVAVSALMVSAYTWFKTHSRHKYDVADAILVDLLKVTLDYPEFRDQEYCRLAVNHSDLETRLRYDAYATLVWNYLETLYDTYGKSLTKSPFYGAMRDLGERHKYWLYEGDKHVDYNPALLGFLRVERGKIGRNT